MYELGKVGWAELGKPEAYRRKYGISNHALKVADIYSTWNFCVHIEPVRLSPTARS